MRINKVDSVSVEVDVESKNHERLNIMLSSDWHYDSTCCDIKLLTEHLKLAEEMGAIVLVAGDMLDAMQGKYDPRKDMEELKEKYKVRSYYDAIVADAAEFLSKFDIPAYILCNGNHELGVLAHADTSLLSTVAYQLRYQYSKQAIAMGYWGYMPITFRYSRGAASSSRLLYWFHGTSSHAIVTKGMIQVNRQGTWLAAPDYIVNGHTHDGWCDPEPIEDYNMKTKKPYRDGKIYFHTPGYMSSPTDTLDPDSWPSTKNRAPKNKGCYFLHLDYSHNRGDIITHSYTGLVT